MPTSPWTNIPTILNIVMELAPRPTKVLDVGIGYGKFGFLLREYLTYWNSPDEARSVTVDGIEGFPDYVQALQRQIYDRIFIGDAREVLRQIPDDSYDLVVMVDVIEHFNVPDGSAVLTECQRVGKAVIVSTPRQFWTQGDSWGNEYERHKSLWTRRDFVARGAVAVNKSENWIAVFARSPYQERFTTRYRIWKLGQKWIPRSLRTALGK